MNDELIAALDDCLAWMAAGASMDACLARYPNLAAELRPLLEAAHAASALGQGEIPRRAETSSRARFLARAAELREANAYRSARARSQDRLRRRALAGWSLAARPLTILLAFGLGLVAGAYGLVQVSAESLPGDNLYGLKRAAERTQLLLASDAESKARLETQLTRRRMEEVQKVTAEGRAVPIEFGGQVEAIAGERWSVTGVEVIVPPEALIGDVPSPGAQVEVHGMSRSDGAVLASRVEVRATSVAPPIYTATPSPMPQPTGTPSPSVTPAPTGTGGVTPPQPTHTPTSGGDSGPSPSNTPKPDDDEENGSGPSPSNTPRPDDDEENGSGPSPSNTPRPDEDDKDGSGPSPSNTPKPKEHDSSGSGGGGGSGSSPTKTPKPEDDD